MPVYHGKDLRKGRYCEAGRPYLITTVVHNRERLFANFWLARLLVNELRDCSERGVVETLAWVVMPDHMHWLMIPMTGSLPEAVQSVKSRSAHAINRARVRQGRVWQKGFHDRALRYDENLSAVARYVVANPLRAGIVKRLGDYPHWDAVWL